VPLKAGVVQLEGGDDVKVTFQLGVVPLKDGVVEFKFPSEFLKCTTFEKAPGAIAAKIKQKTIVNILSA
jgi:hypothetical protein